VTYELGAGLDTRDWIEALILDTPGCWWNIVPAGLDTDAQIALSSRLFDPEDAFDLDDLEDVALAVAEKVLGVDFWVARHLIASAWTNWMTFDSWCVTRGGFSPLEVHPARVVSAAWAWRCSLVSNKREATQLESEVWNQLPPPRASGNARDAAPEGWDDEREAAMFHAGIAGLALIKGGRGAR
jgi:hypothetical protein